MTGFVSAAKAWLPMKCCDRVATEATLGAKRDRIANRARNLSDGPEGQAPGETRDVQPMRSCCRLTSWLSCRATRRALCVCKGRDELNGQLQPFVRRHRACAREHERHSARIALASSATHAEPPRICMAVRASMNTAPIENPTITNVLTRLRRTNSPTSPTEANAVPTSSCQ